MSKHRSLVQATIEALHKPIARALTLLLLDRLCRGGIRSMMIEPLAPVERGATEDARMRAAVRPILRGAAIPDLREVDITVAFHYRIRIVACPVGNIVARRIMRVVDVAIRSRIRTRWVHMWNDWSTEREWPMEYAIE